jgi:hypothetical protein
MNVSPKFPLSIPESIWRSVAVSISPGFADSYLYGAVIHEGSLIPRTVTAYLALKEKASKLLDSIGLDLIKPKPFHEQGRPSAAEELASHFGRGPRT